MVMDLHLTERLNQHTATQGDHYHYRGAHRNLPLRAAAPSSLPPTPTSPPSPPPLARHRASHPSRTRVVVTVMITCTALCALVGGPLAATTATDVRVLHPITRHHSHAARPQPTQPARPAQPPDPAREFDPPPLTLRVNNLGLIDSSLNSPGAQVVHPVTLVNPLTHPTASQLLPLPPLPPPPALYLPFTPAPQSATPTCARITWSTPSPSVSFTPTPTLTVTPTPTESTEVKPTSSSRNPRRYHTRPHHLVPTSTTAVVTPTPTPTPTTTPDE
jgi:hypothetical protein